ncbi:MAG: hypothetical protein HY695_26300 [Deltaproteobacteria bacterium]|nr:hypothetical protein [Deltaproteobacteria bacterium]
MELAEFPVKTIRLGNRFHYDSGILEVDQEELVALVLEDPRVEDASVAVVAPGERVRITGIRDVVEPRVKVQGGGQVFPGVLGPVEPVGDGRTHRLSGMAVVAAAGYEGIIRAGNAVQRSAILDMWGPGADMSRFASLVNLVLILRLPKGLPEIEAHTAIQCSECKVARRLAEVTVGLEPKRVDTYDLSQEKAGLPRVVLIQGCLTDSHHPHSGVGYYGISLRESLATVAHPNEYLDGAVTINATRGVGYSPTIWDWQNHPLIFGLYREHGRRLNFVGTILERIRFETSQGKDLIAQNTAQLAEALRADGALVTWLGSGNAFVDVMLTVRACRRRGIRAVLVTYEHGGKDGTDFPLLYYVEEATAIVSTGTRDGTVELPEADRVVGPYEQLQILSYPGAPVVSAAGPLSLDARDMVIGSVDNWGGQSWACSAY